MEGCCFCDIGRALSGTQARRSGGDSGFSLDSWLLTGPARQLREHDAVYAARQPGGPSGLELFWCLSSPAALLPLRLAKSTTCDKLERLCLPFYQKDGMRRFREPNKGP